MANADEGLRGLALPTTGTAAGVGTAVCERPVDVALRNAARALAASGGWHEDAVAAAAFAFTRARLLGEDDLRLAEATPDGDGLHESTLSPSDGMTGHDLVAGLDAARRRPSQRFSGDVTDAAWCANALDVSPALAPLRVSVPAEAACFRAHYDAAVYDDGMVGILLDACCRAFATLALSPQAPIASADLLGADDRRRLLQEWNPPFAALDAKDSVVAAFRRQVARDGERVALAWDGGTLTFAQLDRLSDALAGCLAAEAPTHGEIIGVALERGADSIIAVLGILKAGAAYLPLDLRYPTDRIAFMLRDAGTRRVIAEGRDANRFPVGTVVLDAAAWCHAEGGAPLPDAPAADDAAYVMYTSGSTGEPKGIAIRHRAVLRLAVHGGFATLDGDAVVLHAAPLGFDASTFEIWGPLLNGGRCVLHPEAVPTGPGLEAAIARHGVTTAWLTAALFNAVVDRDPRHLAGLKELLTGGEALSVPHVRRALEALPGTAIINGYGPTECTTFTCTHRIPRPVDAGARSIPIGRPIGGTVVHIVNAKLEPLPAGLVGELVVGGPGLARGYLGRPELDRERFVASDLGGEDKRLYRTGDLARFGADGVVEFIGRRDGQVKIRGFRIETGEVEAALASHPAVRSCAVVAREDSPGGPRLVAYVVAAGRAPSPAALRAHLAQRLPEFMIPAAFLPLEALPVTPNGKLDKRALPAPDARRPELAQPYLEPAGALEAAVCRVFAELLGIDRAGRRDNFFELGGNSLGVLEATERLGREAGREIPITVFFADPTPAAIAAWIDSGGSEAPAANRRAKARAADAGREPVAIVAMTGRFPGAASVEAFWENLREGRESITRFAPGDLDPSLPPETTGDPTYVSARGVIDGVEDFDAAFFGISPLEARLMDPQQRLFLELCWECLERGGYVPDATPVPVGVFGGMYNSTYAKRHVAAHPDEVARLGEFQVMLGVEKDYIATRTAHRLNLTGPAVSVHTACSTSLVAIAQAVTSLRAGQCDLALAGGASITCPPRSGYPYEEGSMLSPDGHTRTFDQDAQGTVFSDGAAVVLLKRLADALADGDTIHAVIRGVAINNDGGAKASFTAPSVEGQAAVITAALADAAVPAASVSYIEAHGTATPLGDPVEVEALARAYGRDAAGREAIRIGSVKSNMGHLVIAAGATGLIKTAASLAHGEIPATLHFTAPNPKLGLERTPFVVNDRLTPWPRGEAPRRAGVSAFGVGGTNAHVIVEEAPEPSPRPPASGAQLLLVSARTPAALQAATSRLADHFERHPDTDLADAAFTLRTGRKAFAHRACVVASHAAQAAQALARADSPRRASGQAPSAPPAVAFLFPGQGSQYAAMGAALHASEPDFRAAFDECMDALGPGEGARLRERIFGGDADSLTQTALTQPALFAIEYAIARHWMARGVEPGALIGHSVGEFVAAALAGVMHPQDAMRLVAKRGELMQAMPPGSMLAVRAPASQVAPRLPAGVEIAVENSPSLVVVAGPTAAVEAFRESLERDGITSRALVTSHAFHSSLMEDAVPPFERAVRAVALSAPRLPIYSTVHARVLTDAEATDPSYWGRHLREPVRFGPALVALMAGHPGLLLECGPRATLSTLARQQGVAGAVSTCASLADATDNERESLLLAAGRLWTLGVPVDLAPRLARAPRRIVLPTYPFERQRHWLEAAPAATAAVAPLAPPTPPALSAAPPQPVSGADIPMTATATPPRHASLVARLRTLLEDISGLDMAEADAAAPLAELGLDSLTLTQAAIQVKQAFKVNVTFRQLMETYRSIDALAAHLDAQIPADAAPAAVPAPAAMPVVAAGQPAMPAAPAGTFVEEVIRQQMQVMAQQMALLQGIASGAAPAMPAAAPPVASSPVAAPPAAAPAPAPAAAPTDDEAPMKRYDVKKAFGAIARIHTDGTDLTERQRARLDAFMRRYVARTKRSKAYTEEHRPHMADPRVVNGFRPMIKEIVYQIVIGRSKGANVWDLDDNRYVDVLNGFGMNLFGWQPAFVEEAVRRQLDLGYEIGPQHPLSGDVAKLVCELTGHDRAALCNTGSEAVMGAVRIARTVTGRNLIAIFTGSYHGIFDEVIVRATRKHTAVPAAPGIMPNTSQNVIVLDYGTPESMAILKERADELACVLVETVQSRRPDFQPRDFLKELRQVTADAGTLLVFDEVVTGFRSHPGGIQALFGIRADLCTYGKVVGGGFPIGVIAGKREYMDALDGGAWQYGDDSIPTVGVTYFAGTFVRHPLALAAAKAVLLHLKEQGPALQEGLTKRTTAMVEELNDFCRSVGAPIVLKNFASVWKTFFTEDHPLQDLLFAMMRSRGIHILDNFPCFMTTAHGEAEITAIKTAFRESVIELQEADFIPKRAVTPAFDATKPPVPGARIGKDPDGKPAWFVPNPDAPGKYLRLDA